jgi:dTDP-glucose 4,6-dehydratase/UDP-glucose 4-epimerase
MKLLILGSEGFIGSHCIDFFSAHQNEVVGVDIHDYPSKKYQYVKVSRLSPELDEVFAGQNFNAVINAAGSGNVSYSMTHPVIDFEANVLDTIRILDIIRKYRLETKYIHISSAAVYGNPVELPVPETATCVPLSPYGWHKLMAEQLCKEYTAVYNLSTATLRPFSVYGPGLKKQLFWDINQKLIQAGNTIQLYGTGNESRDFIHVHDLVVAIEYVLTYGEMKGETYNVASGMETSIKKAVELFLKYLSPDADVSFNHVVREGDPLNWRANIDKLAGLGFKTSVNLEDGLKETAGWMSNFQ